MSRDQNTLVGQTLQGRYSVEELIGRGGMGATYLAYDRRLSRPVAIKIPDVAVFNEPVVRRRFLLEVQSLASFRHPNIVRIYDAGEADDIPFIVMEYLDGDSLEARLRHGVQTPAQVASWLTPVCAGLDQIHDGGLLHRDIKPGNLIFDADDRPYIADLGIAKAFQDAGAGPGPTGTGLLIGTTAYMGPEAIHVGTPLTPAYDQYALGVTVYEAATGELPFPSGLDARRAFMLKAFEAPALLGAAEAGISDGVRTAIATALDPDPARRYASCWAFATAFNEALDRSEGSAPTAATSTSRTGTGIPRRRALGAAFTLVLASAAGWRVTRRMAATPDSVGPGTLEEAPAALDLSNTAATDDDVIREIGGRTNLTDVNLAGSRITDAGVEALGDQRQLFSLDLAGTSVTDGIAATISTFRRLNTLRLSYTEITDATLDVLSELRALGSLWLSGTSVTDRGVAQLAGLPRLYMLLLDETGVSDDGLARLTDTPIETLDLGGTRVTDEGMRHVGQMGLLTGLSLNDTAISTVGLREISGHDMKTLYLRSTQIDDDAMRLIARFRSLEVLSITDTNVGDEGVSALDGIPSRVLWLGGTNVSDAALPALAPTLEDLGLAYTGVTDAGLRHLTTMSQLSRLGLNGTEVTSDAVGRLRAELPSLVDVTGGTG